jgi:hypothetical protein
LEVRARVAVLDRTGVDHRIGTVDLIPAEIGDLGRPQPAWEGQQDHGGVAVTGFLWRIRLMTYIRQQRNS